MVPKERKLISQRTKAALAAAKACGAVLGGDRAIGHPQGPSATAPALGRRIGGGAGGVSARAGGGVAASGWSRKLGCDRADADQARGAGAKSGQRGLTPSMAGVGAYAPSQAPRMILYLPTRQPTMGRGVMT